MGRLHLALSPTVDGPCRHPSQTFLLPRILPSIQKGGPLPWFLPPLVLRPHRTNLQEFRLWRLLGQQEQLPSRRRVQASLPRCARWAFVGQLWGSGDFPLGLGYLSSPVREVGMRVPHSQAPPSAHPYWDLALPPLTSLFFLSQVPLWKGTIQVGFAPFPISLTHARSPFHIMPMPQHKLRVPNAFLPS